MKLGTVISDVFGVSGRNLLQRLVSQGYVDAADVDACVKGSITNKKQQVQDSLFGTITPHQLELIRDCWEHIEFLEKSLDSLEEKIDAHLQSYLQEYELLQTIPGVSRVTAAALIAEIGVDMGQFPSAEHLSSWAGVAPGNHESAGKKKYKEREGQFTRKSSLMRSGLGNLSLPKHRAIYEVLENCFSARQKKACIATARKILVIAYHMLKNKQRYIEGGPKPVASAS